MPPLFSALGPRPQGDPAGMRAYAAHLRSTATQLAQPANRAIDAIDDATFVGPAGDRARAAAGHYRSRAADQATELLSLAVDIQRRAAQVAREQKAWDKAKAKEDKKDPFPAMPMF